MNHSLERCYEILGLDNQASAHEVKAAYRDLAKVWHPDRFAHDPRLQQKAQDKLKEINDAYERLSSVKPGVRAKPASASNADNAADRGHQQTASNSYETPRTAAASPTPSDSHRHRFQQGIIVFLIVFTVAGALFLFLRAMNHNRGENLQASVSSQPEQKSLAETNKITSNHREAKKLNRQKLTEANGNPVSTSQRADEANVSHVSAQPEATTMRRMATITLRIDPTTNLIATPACPVKSTTTYASGQEPHQHCVRHTAKPTQPQRQNKSRLKSAADRVTSPTKWFQRKKSGDQAPEPPAQN